jgi:hypothetical protein
VPAALLFISGFKSGMKKIFSILFVLILLLPAAAWLIGLDFNINVERIGLKPPRFDGRSLLNNDYYRSFDQYLNDSFSLRDPLVLGKRWLDYHVFDMTDIAGVHVGKHGWLFDRKSIADVQKKACDDKALIAQLVLTLHAIDRIIAASGRQFLFTVAPNKSSIYPEFLGFIPAGESCRRSRYDLLLESLERHPLKGFVRLDNRLLNAKHNTQWLYHPTSIYWNALGAEIAAEAIREQLIEDAADTHTFDRAHDAFNNPVDLARRMLGLSTEIEDGASIQLTSAEFPNRLNAVVYGDDFLKNLVPYLTQMMGRLEVIQTGSVLSKQYYENWQAAKIVLLETAESELASLRLDLDPIFTTLEAQARIPERVAIDIQTLVPIESISLNYRNEALEIKSVGNSSCLALMSVPGSDQHVFRILKLRVEATHTDIMTIEFDNSEPAFVARKTVKSGKTVLYLPLPFQSDVSLSIHPGTRAGVLMLSSAEILGFTDSPGLDEPAQTKNRVADLQSDRGLALKNPGPKNKAPAANTLPNIAVVNKNKNLQKSAAHKEIQIPEPVSSPVVTMESPSITLTDFAEGRIFQRKGNSADIVISGSYSGTVAAIEARVVRSQSLAQVVPWTVIDPSPANGIFVGQLADVPQGGWYTLQVRSHLDHTVSANGQHRWGVGVLIACLGQSNMNEWFHTGNDLKAHPLLRKFGKTGWSKLGTTGNAAIAFGNRVVAQLDIPVGLLDFAVNGSGLRKEADYGTGHWTDTTPGSIYNRFVNGVSAVGGALEFVIWIQGEADAARGTVTQIEYVDALTHFIEDQVRSDITNGSNLAHLPFLVVTMIKRPGGKDKPHQAIRNAQKQVVAEVADCYLAATTLDLKNHGRQHLKPKAYISMGNRVAQTVLFLVGKEHYHRGPQVVNVRRLEDRMVEIIIQHNGGNDFKPSSGISGWEIIANGKQVPIQKVYRHDAQTIRIVTEQPLSGEASIRYLYGAMPDVKNPVLDNSYLSLPLEEYQSVIN